jgi:endonuclease YncB( thermonuclease family)
MDIQLSVQRLLLGAAIAVISLGTQGAELVGRVVAVADGDTLTVLDGERRQYRVRLQGIDAPEKGQDYWRVSKQFLADRVFSQYVTIEYEKRDRYGRLVGRVLREGRDINYEMLQGGAAWFYAKYARELPADRRLNYASAEALSRDAQLGLWRSASPVPPWQWRAEKRMQK